MAISPIFLMVPAASLNEGLLEAPAPVPAPASAPAKPAAKSPVKANTPNRWIPALRLVAGLGYGKMFGSGSCNSGGLCSATNSTLPGFKGGELSANWLFGAFKVGAGVDLTLMDGIERGNGAQTPKAFLISGLIIGGFLFGEDSARVRVGPRLAIAVGTSLGGKVSLGETFDNVNTVGFRLGAETLIRVASGLHVILEPFVAVDFSASLRKDAEGNTGLSGAVSGGLNIGIQIGK